MNRNDVSYTENDEMLISLKQVQAKQGMKRYYVHTTGTYTAYEIMKWSYSYNKSKNSFKYVKGNGYLNLQNVGNDFEMPARHMAIKPYFLKWLSW